MANKRTRRDFLKVTAAGIAGSAAAEMAPPFRPAPPSAAGPVELWMTNETLRCAQGKPAQWRKATPPAGTPTVVLSPDKKFQTIEGFGGAFTDSACFTMNRLAPGPRAELFHDMFHPSALGLSVCRTCMGAAITRPKSSATTKAILTLNFSAFRSITIANMFCRCCRKH